MKAAPLAVAITALLGASACSPRDPAAGLSAIASETQTPPTAERRAVEAAVAHWSQGRFSHGAPRWFVLRKGVPAAAVMKAVDNALDGQARRIVETGPDGGGATMYGWRLGKASGDGHDGLVVAVSRSDPPLAVYYRVRLAAGWPD